jgi:hypothetical protein
MIADTTNRDWEQCPHWVAPLGRASARAVRAGAQTARRRTLSFDGKEDDRNGLVRVTRFRYSSDNV